MESEEERDEERRRYIFISTASASLAASLDHEETLRIIARLAVPGFADWAAIDLLNDDRSLRHVAVEHPDPEKLELVRSLEREHNPFRETREAVRRVIQTGETEFIPVVNSTRNMDRALDDLTLELVQEVRPRSVLIVPIVSGGHSLGAITFLYSEASGRIYSEGDRRMAEDLAARVGTALENARIVQELRDARSRLEKQAEDLEEKSRELESALRRLSLNIEQSPLAVIDTDTVGTVVSWNPGAENTFGYSASEAIGKSISFIFVDGKQIVEQFPDVVDKRLKVRRRMFENIRKDGEIISCDWYATPTVDRDGEVIGVSGIAADYTEQTRLERGAHRQMERLSALRAVDLAIAASMDLQVTLSVLLDQVVTQLSGDAAAVLTVNDFTQRITYAAGRGFRTSGIQETDLNLGEGTVGRAAIERRTISIPGFESSRIFARHKMVEAEGFVSYYCTPLISKGRVTGVLEVYTREQIRADREWINYLETLAGQASIAVDNAKLFENLQRSNVDLEMAYDSTLEGWARALDLRDNVTEGHSRRVTEMAERLARTVGIRDADLINLRRGALLHDIGKMGIPDSILHKPGPLDEEEWKIMRMHPIYAQELLYPIEFLRPALDIPCAHHERWDGKGYPEGMRGEEIPLAARVFAIVDVWDALRSRRSYSAPWPEDKTREEIRSLAGSHLDPDLVDMFLSMDWESPEEQDQDIRTADGAGRSGGRERRRGAREWWKGKEGYKPRFPVPEQYFREGPLEVEPSGERSSEESGKASKSSGNVSREIRKPSKKNGKSAGESGNTGKGAGKSRKPSGEARGGSGNAGPPPEADKPAARPVTGKGGPTKSRPRIQRKRSSS
ncbi:MAG: GAF domain-containing protein [Gemmatimonadota bacterium]|nr:GAF domain-containing protein [Gemmatimonadota bacterium]